MAINHFPNLFQPFQIGTLKLKNRIVMPPMGTNFAEPDAPGFITERHRSYYGERAKGGVGLIIFEGTRVNPKRMARKGGPDLHGDQFIPGFKELTELIKEGGARCAVQLADRGRIGNLKVDFSGTFDKSDTKEGEYVGASAKAHPMSGVVAEELRHEAIGGDRRVLCGGSHEGKESRFRRRGTPRGPWCLVERISVPLFEPADGCVRGGS